MKFCRKIKIDESYFGGVSERKRDRRATKKIPVFGILKCWIDIGIYATYVRFLDISMARSEESCYLENY
jgi:hypothetical protein